MVQVLFRNLRILNVKYLYQKWRVDLFLDSRQTTRIYDFTAHSII